MRIFIAGPMSSSGEPGPNLHQAAVAASRLVEAGHAVYVPHLTWIVDAIRPAPIEQWKESDLAWIDASDAVLRLPGESKGADAEVAYAVELRKRILLNESDA